MFDNSDIDGFVLVLTDPSGYAAAYPACDIHNADANGDGDVDNSDSDAFVDLLTGGNAALYVRYTWDAENRLIRVEPGGDAVAGDKWVDFTYDYMNRRVEKVVHTYSGSSWSVTGTRRYVWNGWLLLMELDGGNQPLKKYTWGLDLAGQMGHCKGDLGSAGGEPGAGMLSGAGGIGGLLAVQDTNGTTTGENPEADDLSYVYFYDANGNVGQVVDLGAANAAGSIRAAYEYDPYGKVNAQSGTYASANTIRFSTKPWDDETGMGYWGERYYDPRLGRWVNPDPIEELGGNNLYGFAVNCPSDKVDSTGLLYLLPRSLWPPYNCLFDSPRRHYGPQTSANDPDKPGVLDCDGVEIKLSRQEVNALLNPTGDPDVARQLDRGCVGLCNYLQGKHLKDSEFWPENDTHTKCFPTQAQAERCKCPDGSPPFIFAKQGVYRHDPAHAPKAKGPKRQWGEPTPADDGSVPGTCIAKPRPGDAFPEFNYVSVVITKGGTKCYLWMNLGATYGTQSLTISSVPHPGHANFLPRTIWCRTCP